MFLNHPADHLAKSAIKGRLDCQVFRDYHALDSLREEWDSTVIRLGGPIYLSYDWTRLWWQFYGRDRELKVLIFRADEEMVGILPLYLDFIGVSPIKLRVARIVGANLPPKTFNPPIAAEYAPQIWSKVIDTLFGEPLCDILSFGPVSSDYAPAQALAAACIDRSSVVAPLATVQRDVRTLYSFPESYEDYFNSLDSKERKVRRKKLRDLETVAPVRADLVNGQSDVGQEFNAFAEAHTRQWQAEGRPGHFHAWPQALEYNRALVECHGRHGRVRFYRLLQGDKVITNQYTFGFGKTLFAELPARMFGSEWAKFSLGSTSQVKLIEAAIQDGFQFMESGLGHYDYKVLTGGMEQPVNILYVSRGTAQSRARIAAWKKCAALQRLLLYKVWYRKIAPRLPASFRSGQSWSQLRLDF